MTGGKMTDAISTDTPWYRRWFGEEYLDLYPHRDQDEARRAVDLLMRRVELAPEARVLDLACGAGRHLQALAGQGLAAVGLDLSEPLLLRARKRVPEAHLVRGDMRWLPLATASVDAVTSFFTSFGYFDSEEEDRRVLGEMRRVLRPGGKVLLDFLNAKSVAADLTPRDEREVDGRRVVQERRLVDEGRKVEKRIHLAPGPNGEPAQQFRERVRLYQPEELEAMMRRADLEPEERLGSYGGDPFGPDSPRVILLAVAR
jgi:SAM-dependent methyltransferase